MIRWIRYGWPRRHVLFPLVDCFPQDSRIRERLLEFLFPSDCSVTFK